MKSIERRLALLEGDSKQAEDMVKVSYQWLNEDGTPSGPEIERTVPRSQTLSLEEIFGEESESGM